MQLFFNFRSIALASHRFDSNLPYAIEQCISRISRSYNEYQRNINLVIDHIFRSDVQSLQNLYSFDFNSLNSNTFQNWVDQNLSRSIQIILSLFAINTNWPPLTDGNNFFSNNNQSDGNYQLSSSSNNNHRSRGRINSVNNNRRPIQSQQKRNVFLINEAF